ncbi:MAG TPA: isoaspartyl peptidase/L-asparaginase [Acidobacteriaceae bacterium]|jgi:N4-(beta-N-acetylglucosaminyl)-L-asparaginase|nr:isoaspartyl peptidase/L-asparaginase [Acidobacteriaceae bacterium]
MTSRRDFLSLGAIAAAGLTTLPDAFADTADQVKQLKPPDQPVIVTRVTGDNTIQQAYQMLLDGQDTLDAVHHVCLGRENDPKDHSVGYGGLPNEDGVVELDSCCMHGPSRAAGSVGGVRNIKNVCLVARKVYQHTGHVMLCAEGAEQFAVDLGFPRENLLTDDARKIWMLWKENNSQMDWWGPGMIDPGWKDPYAGRPAPKPTMDLHGLSSLHKDRVPHVPGVGTWDSAATASSTSAELRPGRVPRHPTPAWAETIRLRTHKLMQMAADLGIAPEDRLYAAEQILWPTTGTIHVSVVNAKGEISGATTTSGLAWKLPGRLGDSPILGAGSWTDQDVGSAGATGSGEENIKVVGAHTIVELMRHGMEPREAGLEVMRRIVRNYNSDMTKVRLLDMEYYIVRKDGAYAGVTLWSTSPTGKPRVFAVNDANGYRVEKCAYLLEGESLEWPPF